MYNQACAVGGLRCRQYIIERAVLVRCLLLVHLPAASAVGCHSYRLLTAQRSVMKVAAEQTSEPQRHTVENSSIMTMKIFSTMPTHMMTVYANFH